MNPKVKQIILTVSLLIIGAYFLVLGAHQIKSFLVPIIIAVLLSFVMFPVTKKLEQWKIPRGLSVLISDLMILGFCVGLFFIVAVQAEDIANKWPQYKKKIEPKIEQVQKYIEQQTGLNPRQQRQEIKESLKGSGSQSGKTIGKFISGVFSTTGNFILVFIYIFFFLYYRKKFKRSFLKFFPEEKRDKAARVFAEFGRVSQQYLFGRFILIVFLAILYSVGLTISGVKHAILVSVLAAVLSLIPYIGNIIGVVLAVLLGLLTQQGAGVVAGVLITFSIAQFVESYILEPYVVGNRVDLNPAFTIIGVVAGGAIWGIAGMIIAIPLMGIFKAVFDQVPVLNPMGHLLGEEGIEHGPSWTEKIKKLWKKKS